MVHFQDRNNNLSSYILKTMIQHKNYKTMDQEEEAQHHSRLNSEVELWSNEFEIEVEVNIEFMGFSEKVCNIRWKFPYELGIFPLESSTRIPDLGEIPRLIMKIRPEVGKKKFMTVRSN